jgi:hypothetical protein
MRHRTNFAVTLLVCLLFVSPSFAQLKLDVVIEGPWLFYEEPAFPTTTGTSPVLVAIAPKVLGHHPLFFSAGDGAQIPSGIYCVAFDGACKTNSIAKLDKDGYAKPIPVPVSKPVGWNWTGYTGDMYVLVLPMPDSYSSDGLYGMTFQSSFPSPTGPPTTTSTGPQSIGVVLHYTSGPQKIGLLTCTGTPSVTNCNQGSVTDEANSGTLQIKIRSKEDPANPDSCDYHVHRAYHETLKLLDPLMQYNQNRAYLGVPSYNSCAKCDPQQDKVPSECTGTTMTGSMAYDAGESVMPIQSKLKSIVARLQKIDVNAETREKLLLDLPEQSNRLNGKFPRLSELRHLKETLASSQVTAGRVLADLKDKVRADAAKNWNAARDLQTAMTSEQNLIDTADRWTVLSISGKDCRTPALLIQ